jgi:hypothetical protein
MSCFTQLEDGARFCHVCGYDNAAQETPPHQLPPHTILNGKYLVGRVLGEGGFGITYIGYDLNLDIKVAIKEYYPTGFVTRENTAMHTVQPFTGSQGDFFAKGRERFVDEAKRLAKFRSLPGIVTANDFFIENGTAYIAMEYIEGQTLKSFLAQNGGKLPAAQVFDMMRPVMTSLGEVHNSGIIHRDISPDNIMVSREGYLKLLDFGAAREFIDSGNKSLSILLKPGFAPEEQYRSKGIQGPWTDVYALSATIYRAITGVTPDESAERMRVDEVKPPSALGIIINPAQEAALMKGMAVLQENRWQSVGELYAALYGAQSAPASFAAPVYTAERTSIPVTPAGEPVSMPGSEGAFPQTGFGTGVPGDFPPTGFGPGAPGDFPPTGFRPGSPGAYPQTGFGPGSSGAYPQTGFGPGFPAPAPKSARSPFIAWVAEHKIAVIISALCLVVVGVSMAFLLGGNKNSSAAEPTPTPSATASPRVSEPVDSPEPSARPGTIRIGGKTVDIDVTELDLEECDVSDISALAELTNIEELYLADNSISDISPLAGLTTLEVLDLQANSISNISPLAGLTNLYNLTLWDNNISDISALKGLTGLTYLDLDDNNISDLSALSELTNLGSLYLSGNPLTQSQVDGLRQALPNCDITADGLDGTTETQPVSDLMQINKSASWGNEGSGLTLYYPYNNDDSNLIGIWYKNAGSEAGKVDVGQFLDFTWSVDGDNYIGISGLVVTKESNGDYSVCEYVTSQIDNTNFAQGYGVKYYAATGTIEYGYWEDGDLVTIFDSPNDFPSGYTLEVETTNEDGTGDITAIALTDPSGSTGYFAPADNIMVYTHNENYVFYFGNENYTFAFENAIETAYYDRNGDFLYALDSDS